MTHRLCNWCEGKGWVNAIPGHGFAQKPCPVCNGTKEIECRPDGIAVGAIVKLLEFAEKAGDFNPEDISAAKEQFWDLQHQAINNTTNQTEKETTK